jgi:transcriptional regulator with XRE-family HTH domain
VLEQEPPFGLYIGRLRDERGLSLRQAAKRIGVSFSRLGEWERATDSHTGKAVLPPRAAIVDIARAYGVPADALLALAGYRTSQDPATPDEVQMLSAFRRLPLARQRELLGAIQAEAHKVDGPGRGRPGP